MSLQTNVCTWFYNIYNFISSSDDVEFLLSHTPQLICFSQKIWPEDDAPYFTCINKRLKPYVFHSVMLQTHITIFKLISQE